LSVLENGRRRKKERKSNGFHSPIRGLRLVALACFCVSSFSLTTSSLSSLFRHQKRSFKTLEGGTPQFEVREYPPATWSTTSFPAGTAWDEVRSKGFDRNFNYIKGAGVAMTAPVLTRVSGDGSFSVSFLVPSKYGTSPPAPKPDSGVKIEESPVRRVVVRSWVGADPKFESQRDVDAAFAALMADADAAGLIVGAPPKDGGLQGWTAGYDSPMTDPSKRRHEVWLPLVARKSEVAPAERGKAAVAVSSAQP